MPAAPRHLSGILGDCAGKTSKTRNYPTDADVNSQAVEDANSGTGSNNVPNGLAWIFFRNEDVLDQNRSHPGGNRHQRVLGRYGWVVLFRRLVPNSVCGVATGSSASNTCPDVGARA